MFYVLPQNAAPGLYPVFEFLLRRTAVGLPVIVEFRVMNPLDLKIELSDLRLFGVLLPSLPSLKTKTAGQDDAIESGTHLSGEAQSKALINKEEHVVFSAVNLELEPTASATIRLTATPLKPGRLILQGKADRTKITLLEIKEKKQ